MWGKSLKLSLKAVLFFLRKCYHKKITVVFEMISQFLFVLKMENILLQFWTLSSFKLSRTTLWPGSHFSLNHYRVDSVEVNK